MTVMKVKWIYTALMFTALVCACSPEDKKGHSGPDTPSNPDSPARTLLEKTWTFSYVKASDADNAALEESQPDWVGKHILYSDDDRESTITTFEAEGKTAGAMNGWTFANGQPYLKGIYMDDGFLVKVPVESIPFGNELSFSGSLAGSGSAASFFIVEYSEDGGSTWKAAEGTSQMTIVDNTFSYHAEAKDSFDEGAGDFKATFTTGSEIKDTLFLRLRVSANYRITRSNSTGSNPITTLGSGSNRLRGVFSLKEARDYSKDFSAGDGSEADPYIIDSPMALEALSALVKSPKTRDAFSGKAYRMTADIDLAGIAGFIPIGNNTDDIPFTGIFDGDSHTISNLHIKVREKAGAGLFGYLKGATLRNLILSKAAIASDSRYVGGFAGWAENSVIENCSISDGSEVHTDYHNAGGIAGYLKGGRIKDCISEAMVNSKGSYAGGIVSVIEDGTVEHCAVGSAGQVGAYHYSVGGIAGAFITVSQGQAPVIDKCVSYADIQGEYNVGGIVGHAYTKPDGVVVTIRNSAVIGSTIKATGVNGNNYALAGGIVGWVQGTGSAQILNSFSRAELLWSTSGHIGGISALDGFNNSSLLTMTACYSTLKGENTLTGGHTIAAAATKNCGPIYGRSSSAGQFTCNYYTKTYPNTSSKAATVVETSCEGLTDAQFTDGTLLGKLQSASATVPGAESWIAGADAYPTLSCLIADPHPRSGKAKRVSIIGDSISTFRGYLANSTYRTHYPASDGTVTMVSQTYWYKLIYNYMSDAVFDTNISFSGSAVTRTTKETSTEQPWFGHDFNARYLECGGVGRPDIVLIHGGTNDHGHNVDNLAPNYPMRSETMPGKALMDAVYSVADKAVGFDAIAALPDTTFCEAYCKLLRLVQNQYPSVKIVCITGDYYYTSAIPDAIVDMANHYGARPVDLYSVNGFNAVTNDPSWNPMPKHDYNPATKKGCHPAEEGMEFIANKIYTELGSWLEQ